MVGSVYAGLYPYVTNETRAEWEAFSMKNMGWVNQSRVFQSNFRSIHKGSDQENTDDVFPTRRLGDKDYDGLYYRSPSPNVSWTGTDGASPKLFRYGREEGEGYLVVEDSAGPYFPMWHLSPVRDSTESYINYNSNDPYLGEAYTTGLETVRRTHTAVFGGVWNVDDDGYILEDDDYDTRTVPAAAVIYPIFDKLISDNRTVVGVLEFDLEFGPYFRAVLPPDSKHIVCVVSNTCGQTFSYAIDGASVVYRGAYPVSENDDVVRRDLVRTALFTDFDVQREEAVFYSGVPVNDEHCPWTLSIYPTSEFEAQYVTYSSLYFALALSVSFLLSCLGLLYREKRS